MGNIICYNFGVALTKWVDSGVVTLGSDFLGVVSHDSCQRWGKKNKEYIKGSATL